MEELKKEIEELRQANRVLAAVEQERGRLEVELKKLQSETGGQGGNDSKFQKKDMGLQNLIKPWSGESGSSTVQSFLRELELVAASGAWTEGDKALVCRLKLTGAAALFASGHEAFQEIGATYEQLKTALIERFKEVMTPEQNLLALNAIKQRSGEGVLSFADRCRQLGERTLTGAGDLTQRAWERRHTERIVLTAFIQGLAGEAGRQLRYHPPRDLQEATRMAATIELVEGGQKKEESGPELFAVGRQRAPRPRRGGACFRCGRDGHFARECRYSPPPPQGGNYRAGVESRQSGPGCYTCGEQGHIARDCPRRVFPRTDRQRIPQALAAEVAGYPNGLLPLPAPMTGGALEH